MKLKERKDEVRKQGEKVHRKQNKAEKKEMKEEGLTCVYLCVCVCEVMRLFPPKNGDMEGKGVNGEVRSLRKY